MARRETKLVKTQGATLKHATERRSLNIDLSKLSALKHIQWTPVFAVSLVCLTAILLTVYWDPMVRSIDREVTQIEIRGELKYQQPDVLQAVLNKRLGEGFLSLDLNKLKEEIEEMPWIYSASLRRRWPGTVMITVKEQYPVARWNGEFFLNEYGEAFRPSDTVVIDDIPELTGPEGRAKDMLSKYVSYTEQLGAVNERIASLSLETRGAWRIRLQNGIEIKLGRAPLDEKLGRLLRAYQLGLNSKASEITSIDARYTNGIAVRWKDSPNKEGRESGAI